MRPCGLRGPDAARRRHARPGDPAVNATRDLLPHLPNGHQVVLAELGHTNSFWSYEPKASARLINTFFETGKVDTSLYTPAKVDFTPDVTHAALGKGFAATMLALPVVVLLSLLLLWRRVSRRGRIGRVASVLLRSLYTVVAGLSGWFAGVIVVLVAFPATPLDDPVLAIASVGVPIGLLVHLASTDRAKRVHLRWVSVMAGALIGAHFGFQVRRDWPPC